TDGLRQTRELERVRASDRPEARAASGLRRHRSRRMAADDSGTPAASLGALVRELGTAPSSPGFTQALSTLVSRTADPSQALRGRLGSLGVPEALTGALRSAHETPGPVRTYTVAALAHLLQEPELARGSLHTDDVVLLVALLREGSSNEQVTGVTLGGVGVGVVVVVVMGPPGLLASQTCSPARAERPSLALAWALAGKLLLLESHEPTRFTLGRSDGSVPYGSCVPRGPTGAE
ncbi:hypothetical protein T492DRAFT_1130374, partial [Pavlovales sp. CCMP2436]